MERWWRKVKEYSSLEVASAWGNHSWQQLITSLINLPTKDKLHRLDQYYNESLLFAKDLHDLELLQIRVDTYINQLRRQGWLDDEYRVITPPPPRKEHIVCL